VEGCSRAWHKQYAVHSKLPRILCYRQAFFVPLPGTTVENNQYLSAARVRSGRQAHCRTGRCFHMATCLRVLLPGCSSWSWCHQPVANDGDLQLKTSVAAKLAAIAQHHFSGTKAQLHGLGRGGLSIGTTTSSVQQCQLQRLPCQRSCRWQLPTVGELLSWDQRGCEVYS
jgi:hypothetical protein